MKKLLAVAILTFIGFTVQAQSIEFESETVDYGEIEQGSNGLREFVFKNTGDAPLLIEKVTSSCGCTVPEKPEGPVQPGETGIIKVKYDTKRVGPIRKTITVYSNADTPTKAVKIKGTVLAKNDKSVLEQ